MTLKGIITHPVAELTAIAAWLATSSGLLFHTASVLTFTIVPNTSFPVPRPALEAVTFALAGLYIAVRLGALGSSLKRRVLE